MIMLRCCILLFLAIWSVSPIADEAPDSFQIAPAGDWVKVQRPNISDEIDQQRVYGGTHYLLVDNQINAVNGYQRYKAFAMQVLNTESVADESTITIDYKPEYQTLTFHEIFIVRDGKQLNRLKADEFEFFQREKDLENQLYDGRLTANIVLRDVRVGDIIFYSYSVAGINPILEGVSTGSFSMEWEVSVAQVYRRLLWPKEKNLFIKYHGHDYQPTSTDSDGVVEHIWDIRNPEAILMDDDVPEWFDEHAWIQFSEVNSWESVRDKALNIYKISADDINAIKLIASEFKNSTDDKEQQIIMAMRFVQDEIRYTGFELGLNSFVPYSPKTALSRRFGDCKDKTMLFLSLLQEMGITASPVLVNSEYNNDLNRYLPGLNLFDHMIAKVDHGGERYWIDLTRTNQSTKLQHVYQPDYNHALVVDSSSQSLQAMQSFDLIDKTLEVSEVFDLSKGLNKPIDYTITSRYYHYRADRMRNYVASINKEKLQKEYFDYMNEIHDDLSILEPMQITDDRENNIFTVIERYQANDLWKTDDGTDYIYVYQYEINGALTLPDSKERNTPYALTHPVRIKQNTTFIMPETWPVQESNVIIENSNVYFSSVVSGGNNVLRMESAFQTRKAFVDVAEMDDYVKKVNQISDDIEFYVYKDSNISDTTSVNDELKSYIEIFETLVDEISLVHFLAFFAPLILLTTFLIYTYQYQGDNPWLSVWFHPVITINQILDRDPAKFVLLLFAVNGVFKLVDRAVAKSLGEKYSAEMIWAICTSFGIFTGIISGYLFAWLLSKVGRWFGGDIDSATLRSCLAWCNAPTVFALAITILLSILLGQSFFAEDMGMGSSNYTLLSLVYGLIVTEAIIIIWSYVICVGMLADVQNFSIGRTLGATITAFMLILSVLFIVIIAIVVMVKVVS